MDAPHGDTLQLVVRAGLIERGALKGHQHCGAGGCCLAPLLHCSSSTAVTARAQSIASCKALCQRVLHVALANQYFIWLQCAGMVSMVKEVVR